MLRPPQVVDCSIASLIASPSTPAIAQASGIAKLTYSLLTNFVLRLLPLLLLLWWSLMQVLYPLNACRLSLLRIFGIWANRCRPPRPQLVEQLLLMLSCFL